MAIDRPYDRLVSFGWFCMSGKLNKKCNKDEKKQNQREERSKGKEENNRR